MAPLPDNNTGIYYVDYTANGRGHTAQFRYNNPSGPLPPTTGMMGQVANFLNAIAPLMPTDFAITGARFQIEGANHTNPAAVPLLTVAGVYTPHASDVPAFISFIGRSSGGRRARVYMLGAGLDPADGVGNWNDYRLTSAENATIAAAVTVLNGAAIVAIDKVEPLWYEYANLGYHAYWQKAVRP